MPYSEPHTHLLLQIITTRTHSSQLTTTPQGTAAEDMSAFLTDNCVFLQKTVRTKAGTAFLVYNLHKHIWIVWFVWVLFTVASGLQLTFFIFDSMCFLDKTLWCTARNLWLGIWMYLLFTTIHCYYYFQYSTTSQVPVLPSQTSKDSQSPVVCELFTVCMCWKSRM